MSENSLRKPNPLSQILQLLKKDFLFITREKYSFFVPFIFGFSSAVFLSFGLPYEVLSSHSYSIFWIVLLFSSVFPAQELMKYEEREEVILGILNSPVRKEVFFISKFFAVFFIFISVGTALFLFFVFFANMNLSLYAFLSFVLGGIGIVSLSVVFSSFFVKENINIPILIFLFPFFIPVIVGAISFSDGAFSSLKIILGFDLTNFFLSLALFDLER